MKDLLMDEVKCITGGTYTMTVVFEVPPTAEMWMAIAATTVASGEIKTADDLIKWLGQIESNVIPNFDTVIISGIYFTNIAN
jgi:hypothetical protein